MLAGLFDRGAMPGGRIRTRWPVYFVRHGQTDWNAEKRFQGHSDIPINETGRFQALRNGRALAAELGDPPSLRCYASPLSRATETLEIIRETLRLPRKRYTIDDRLIEIDLGAWNGKTPDEIDEEDPGVFDRREKNKWTFTVPGGESYAKAAMRTREFLLELDGPAIVAGHGASGRILRGYLGPWRRDDVAHIPTRQDVVYKLENMRETEI